MKKRRCMIVISIVIIAIISLFIGGRNRVKYESEFYRYDDYKRIGIKDGEVEVWEDGMRTDGKENSLEWWYSDAEFEDGTTIVVVFFSKDGFDVEGPAHPKGTIEITYPNGEKVFKSIYSSKGEVIDASKEKCDVKINDSYLTYIDGDYVIHFEDDTLKYHAKMKSTLPMWRPGTGHSFYGPEREEYFAWVVGQPACEIEAELEVDGQVSELRGKGYHDHNWGNVSMNKVVDHWYWGRAQIDGYTIITSDLVTADSYGNYRLPVMMIAKDGDIIPIDIEKIYVERKDSIQHPVTGKFMDNSIIIKYTGDDGTMYTVQYERKKDILVSSLLDRLPPTKKMLAKLVGANPTYIRIGGDVTLTVESIRGKKTYSGEGLWEQMSFDKEKNEIINEYNRLK